MRCRAVTLEGASCSASMAATKWCVVAGVCAALALTLFGCAEPCAVFVNMEQVNSPKAVYECNAPCSGINNWCKGDECSTCVNENGEQAYGDGWCGTKGVKPNISTTTPAPPGTRQRCEFKVAPECCADLLKNSPFQNKIDAQGTSCSEADVEAIDTATCTQVSSTGTCKEDAADEAAWIENCRSDLDASKRDCVSASTGSQDKDCMRGKFSRYSQACGDSIFDFDSACASLAVQKCALKCVGNPFKDDCVLCTEEAAVTSGKVSIFEQSSGVAHCPFVKYQENGPSALYMVAPAFLRSPASSAAGACALACVAVLVGVTLFLRRRRRAGAVLSQEEGMDEMLAAPAQD